MTSFRERMKALGTNDLGKAVFLEKGILLTVEKDKIKREKIVEGEISIFIGEDKTTGKPKVWQMTAKPNPEQFKGGKASKSKSNTILIVGNATESEKGIICTIRTKEVQKDLVDEKGFFIFFIADNKNGNLYISQMPPKVAEAEEKESKEDSAEDEDAPW